MENPTLKKLDSYQRKSYQNLVSFPIETVNTSGQIQQLGFYDAINLYELRLSQAHLRYKLPYLIFAEQIHARSRIAQIRRSYSLHYGWDTFFISSQNEATLTQEEEGELCAFLQKQFPYRRISSRNTSNCLKTSREFIFAKNRIISLT